MHLGMVTWMMNYLNQNLIWFEQVNVEDCSFHQISPKAFYGDPKATSFETMSFGCYYIWLELV